MKNKGFTLIEMMVVVVIIAILAMIVFKLIGAGGASSDRASARRSLELLSNAIEEYRAEYGKYPPVAKDRKGGQPLMYEYPGSRDYWTSGGSSGAQALANSLKQVPRDQAIVFTFGLMSYLVTRVEGRAENAYQSLFEKAPNISVNQSHWLCENQKKTKPKTESGDINNVMDNPRDVKMANKVKPYLQDIMGTQILERQYNGEYYTNTYCSVWDPWGNQLNYRSDPPYDSYKIWSNGPDGKSGTADDIIAGIE